MARIGKSDVVVLVGGELDDDGLRRLQDSIGHAEVSLVEVIQCVVDARINTDHPVTGGAAFIVGPRQDGEER